MHWKFGLVFCLSATLSAEESTQVSPQDPGLIRDATGRVHQITSPEAWAIRREAILKHFETVAGPLPSRAKLPVLDIQVSELTTESSFIKKKISFAAERGDRITAFLYIPFQGEPGKKMAGIVALHPTHKIGKGVVDGQSERPNRGYARELAERGYVVIAPDYPSFGEAPGYDFLSDRYESGTMKGIWNHMRCVDLLVSLPEVDSSRLGAIGHSLGGHNAIFLGMYDERIKVIVSSCGWTPFHDYYGGNLKGWTSERYLPRIRSEYNLDPDKVPFDFYGLVATLAPRAFFSNSPLHDSNFDYRGVEKAAPKIRRIYELFGKPNKLRITYPNAEHDFPVEVRMESYEFLGNELAE